MALAEEQRSVRPLRRTIGSLLVYAVLAGAATAADEEPQPDLELLAYLGSWLGDDEEWVAIAEWDGKIDADAPQEEAAPEQENDDE